VEEIMCLATVTEQRGRWQQNREDSLSVNGE
jgi:hypothetical protein